MTSHSNRRSQGRSLSVAIPTALTIRKYNSNHSEWSKRTAIEAQWYRNGPDQSDACASCASGCGERRSLFATTRNIALIAVRYNSVEAKYVERYDSLDQAASVTQVSQKPAMARYSQSWRRTSHSVAATRVAS